MSKLRKRKAPQRTLALPQHGIIHRDLKPANIKLRPDGAVKVLDFGLAKVIERAGSATANPNANSLTATSPARMTQAGVILGTAAYMSPEQAKGKVLDRRTDLWAFGAVVYEMLTGRATFSGESVSQVIAELLKSEPDWKALPASVPPAVVRLLVRCLQKDPKQRLDSAAVARVELEEATIPTATSTP